MKSEDTICYKITESLSELEQALLTDELDVPLLAERLHSIRTDAQNMENALKARKQVMEEAGIEDKYQQAKAKADITPGINKIRNDKEQRTREEINVEVTLKQNGEVVYQTTAHAGVLCFVEKIEDMDEHGHISGQTQKYIFGKPITLWYAFDQLRIGMEGRLVSLMHDLKALVETGAILDPQVRKKIIDAANGK